MIDAFHPVVLSVLGTAILFCLVLIIWGGTWKNYSGDEE